MSEILLKCKIFRSMLATIYIGNGFQVGSGHRKGRWTIKKTTRVIFRKQTVVTTTIVDGHVVDESTEEVGLVGFMTNDDIEIVISV